MVSGVGKINKINYLSLERLAGPGHGVLKTFFPIIGCSSKERASDLFSHFCFKKTFGASQKMTNFKPKNNPHFNINTIIIVCIWYFVGEGGGV